jgi:multidrug resistance efflux pump
MESVHQAGGGVLRAEAAVPQAEAAVPQAEAAVLQAEAAVPQARLSITGKNARQSFSPCKKPLIHLQILHSPFSILHC